MCSRSHGPSASNARPPGPRGLAGAWGLGLMSDNEGGVVYCVLGKHYFDQVSPPGVADLPGGAHCTAYYTRDWYDARGRRMSSPQL